MEMTACTTADKLSVLIRCVGDNDDSWSVVSQCCTTSSIDWDALLSTSQQGDSDLEDGGEFQHSVGLEPSLAGGSANVREDVCAERGEEPANTITEGPGRETDQMAKGQWRLSMTRLQLLFLNKCSTRNVNPGRSEKPLIL